MKKLLNENLGLKILSLMLAIFLEAYFYGPNSQVTSAVSVPIEFRNLPPSMIIVKPVGAERGLYARVIATGPKPLVDEFITINNRFVFDLTGEKSEKIQVHLKEEQLRAPPRISLSIQPNRIDLELEKLQKRNLVVNVPTEGVLKEGYFISKISVTPPMVVAEGPKSELANDAEVLTLPLNITGVSRSFSRETVLVNPYELTKYDIHSVRVDAEVLAIKSVKRFTKKNVTVLAPSGYAATVEPSKVTVSITGPEEEINKISEESLILNADARLLPPGRHSLQVTAELPEGVHIVNSEPGEVTVTLVSKDG